MAKYYQKNSEELYLDADAALTKYGFSVAFLAAAVLNAGANVAKYDTSTEGGFAVSYLDAELKECLLKWS